MAIAVSEAELRAILARVPARVLKLGRRLVYGVAECVNGEGRLLAHHSVTYARPGQ